VDVTDPVVFIAVVCAKVVTAGSVESLFVVNTGAVGVVLICRVVADDEVVSTLTVVGIVLVVLIKLANVVFNVSAGVLV